VRCAGAEYDRGEHVIRMCDDVLPASQRLATSGAALRPPTNEVRMGRSGATSSPDTRSSILVNRRKFPRPMVLGAHRSR
jgi:hypothetical protein